jgi:hypothetical protein
MENEHYLRGLGYVISKHKTLLAIKQLKGCVPFNKVRIFVNNIGWNHKNNYERSY